MVEERGPRTEADEVERRAEDHEFDEAVTAALAELPENFRRVVELVDVDGLTYQEAADVLDVPLGHRHESPAPRPPPHPGPARAGRASARACTTTTATPSSRPPSPSRTSPE